MKCIGIIMMSIPFSILAPLVSGCHKSPNASIGPQWGSLVSAAEIVFMAEIKTDSLGPQGYELEVMNLDGSNRHQLTNNNEEEFLPHFSPDGTRILYTRFTSGSYGLAGSQSRVTVYDFATGTTRDLTTTGKDSYPVWSPDGSQIAFLSSWNDSQYRALWVMNADGSGPHEIGHPTGADSDLTWGDLAWSSQNWILFVVGEKSDTCYKARLDKIRPDGTGRTEVTDGGPNCVGPGLEQCGDADPGFSPDGNMIYTSRGFPYAPKGMPGQTARNLYAISSDAWYPCKPERDLSPTSSHNCIEGIPKVAPDGKNILFFFACTGQPSGITLTDIAASHQQWITNGFGPDWNPVWKLLPLLCP